MKRVISTAALFALVGCIGSAGNDQNGGGGPGGMGGPGGSGPGDAPDLATDPLAARVVNYSAALRTAALKLVGTLPTMYEVSQVGYAPTPGAYQSKWKAPYEALIDSYLADPRFVRQTFSYFQDMMKMGGSITVTAANQQQVTVDLNAAPLLATSLAAQDKSLLDMFTAPMNCTTATPDLTQNQLPAAGSNFTFAQAACASATNLPGGQHVGIITTPGAMAQFYSNMAFRRVRWLQEAFACSRFPAEYAAKDQQQKMGAGIYTGVFPFSSITGKVNTPTALVDFQDTSAVICANCHSNINHIAPLFMNFDATGVYQTTSQVMTPVAGTPKTVIGDYLPMAEQSNLSWRFGKPAPNLAALGMAIAADPTVASCQVKRAWNWAMSKGEIVEDAAFVPDSVVAAQVSAFTSGGYKFKALVKSIFTSDDFVRF
jgi:hypothetical protein